MSRKTLYNRALFLMVLGYFLWRKQRTRILLIFKRGFYPIISVNQRYQSIRLISVLQNCSKNLFNQIEMVL